MFSKKSETPPLVVQEILKYLEFSNAKLKEMISALDELIKKFDK